MKLIKKYPWLKYYSKNVSDYIYPNYYDNLLKDYIFDNLTDLDHFKDYLDRNFKKNKPNEILELGCGSGRATKVLISSIRDFNSLKLVDLSPYMVSHSKKRFLSDDRISFFTEDSIKFLDKTNSKYDFVFSLWSLSHSLHGHLEKKGIKKGSLYIKRVLKSFLKKKLNKDAKIFIIHFDSLSDEQKIVKKQEAKTSIVYKNKLNKQSYSKEIIDDILQKLSKERMIKFKCSHYRGQEIKYEDVNKALEIFMNFHMETYFNRDSDVEDVIKEIKNDFKPHIKDNGEVHISPRCFIYEISRS